MRPLTDLDEGTIRRIDWLSLVPPVLFLRAFGLTFRPFFIALFALGLTVAGLCLHVGCLGDNFERFVDLARLGGFNCSECEIFGDCPLSVGRILALSASVLVALWWGTALSRSSVVQLASSSRSSTFASMKFAMQKIPTILGFMIVLGICASLLLFVPFVVSKLGMCGVALAPIVTIGLFFLVFLFAALAFALPLSISAIAADNSDVFDAISRGVSYLTQRLLVFIIYAVLSIGLTYIGTVIVRRLVVCCLRLLVTSYVGSFNVWTRFWIATVAFIPLAYLASSLVVYSNAIYLLLRRSLDGTPYDAFSSDQKGKPRRLREILQDEKGAPIFDEAVAVQNAPDSGKKEDEVS